MLQGRCVSCAATPPLGTMFVEGSRAYCAACAHRLSEDAARNKQKVQLLAVIDPTVCYKCKADNNSTEFPRMGGRPFCPACRETLYHREFPRWLTLSLAAMFLLLAVALVHGEKYFRAGRSLYRGEKLIAHHQPAQAVPLLESVVHMAPDCQKCILLLAKADFLSGNPAPAFDALKYNGGKFEENGLTAEVKSIVDRVSNAFQAFEEAGKLSQAENSAAAATAVRRAQSLYPEFALWPRIIDELDASAAYERKDYDAFLLLSQKLEQNSSSSSLAAAQVASALACKYVVTNDPSFRVRAEAELAKAQQLAVTPEEKKSYDEYKPRILHRLNSRTIISINEYNRRFRPELLKQEQTP